MEIERSTLPHGRLSTLRIRRSASIRRERLNDGTLVTEFGDFPPVFHSLVTRHNLTRLSYQATSGQWNPLWSGDQLISALPPAGGMIVAAARDMDMTSLASSWKQLVEDCAAVFGGAIGGEFSRTPPFPFFNTSTEAPQLGQYFLQDSASAEAITALLADSFLASEAELRLLPSRKMLYESPWFGFSFHASSLASLAIPTAMTMELEVKWFEYSSPHESSISPSPLVAHDSLQIQRRAWEEGQGLFSVATTLRNPSLQPSHVHCLEVIPDLYDLLMHTFYFHSSEQSRLVADLPSLQWSRNCPTPTTTDLHCSRTLSFDLWLPANDTVELRFQAKKRIANIFFIPPDASRGLVIPPLFLVTSLGQQALYSSPLLLSAPIPDLSMPYTVYTLISTLFAFLLGSIINIYVRRVRPPPLTDTASKAVLPLPPPPTTEAAQ